MKPLAQQTAIVTGGASGLGKAVAQRLSSEGARVIITDRDAELGDTVADQYGFAFIKQDVTDEAGWLELIGETERRFGRLHILVNNAGILGPSDAANPENSTLDEWRKIFAVNVEGVFLGCKAAIPAMRRTGRGAIVNFSSMADAMATPFSTAYGASKAAVAHFTRSLAQHCAQEKLNIRCNSIHPGMIRTPMVQKLFEETAEAMGTEADVIAGHASSTIPLGGFTQPEDIAAGVAFLVSDDARHITGSALRVDGGLISCNSFRLTQ